MGNEGIKTNQKNGNRRRSLPTKNYDDSTSQIQHKDYNTINQSLEVPPASAAARRYHSIDLESVVDDGRSIKSDRIFKKEQAERNTILKKLSRKNQELRRQLKQISDELTAQIKHKKFVPKKRGADIDEDDVEEKNQANAGLRRQLENGYRQVEMYKRTLQALKGKNEEHQSDARIKRIQNSIASTDQQINIYAKKLQGVKNITRVQDKVIDKDINDDLKNGVLTLKKEAEQIRKTVKEYAKRDRQREMNYKKQQAYLFSVERKYREVNGDYFPQLKKKGQNGAAPGSSRVTHVGKHEHHDLSVDDYFALQEELNRQKILHEDYHRKIDAKVLQKNKMLDDQAIIDQSIRYNEKVIESLKMKLAQIRKIFKPTKKSLFGYDNNYSGQELQSEYNGGVDQIEKEIQQQVYQDQFDIKHLIANIPKPARQKVIIEFQDQGKGKKPVPIPREVSKDKGGMIISGQKSEPKKWGSSLTRTEEKGRSIKRENPFDDSQVCPPESKPLVIGVNIWVNKNNGILGIQAIYLIGDQIRYGSKSANAVDGFLQRYDLQSPDYLKNVTGAFNHEGYLEYLILYSKQGKVGTFGFKGEDQEQFNYGLSSSQRPFRMSGASFVFDSEPRINRLGLEICQEE